MPCQQHLQDFQKLIHQLIEYNQQVPVVVEGQRDAESLRHLGLTGEILKLHTGKTIHDFCEELAQRYSQFILLIDWDERGNDLLTKIGRHLETGWQEFSYFRTGLTTLCGKNLQEVEDLASWFESLQAEAEGSTPDTQDMH
jgi:5S rRNA maturation endonuclease (ribonuclease M5)